MGNKKHSLFTKIFLLMWICSLFVFFFFLQISSTTSGPTESIDKNTRITVISGIFFFVILFISAVIDENNNKKTINSNDSKDKKSPNYGVMIIVFLTIIGIIFLDYLNNLKEQNENLLNTVSNLNRKVEEISLDDKGVENSQVIQPIQQKQITDNDPVVDCPKGDNCGGGVRKLKKSICSNSTCCQVSKDKWVFMESKEQCYRQQDFNYQEASKYWSITVEGNSYSCDINFKRDIYNAYDNLKKYSNFYDECVYVKEHASDDFIKVSCESAKSDMEGADEVFWNLIERNCKKK